MTAIPVPGETRPLILVADDDPAGRLLLAETLAASGFDVLEAADGEPAVEIFSWRRPDLVVLDVLMPRLDGFGACARIRSLPYGQLTPILVTTGLDDMDSIRRAYEVGATDFVTKPINGTIFSQRVRYMLRASHAVLGLRRSEARLAAAQRISRLGHFELDLATGESLWSDETIRILGSTAVESRPSWMAFLAKLQEDDRARAVHAVDDAIRSRRPFGLDVRIAGSEGERHVHLQGAVVSEPADGRSRVAGTIQDITERKLAEERIRFLAYYDELTRLPNRQLFVERLGRAIADSGTTGRPIAVLFADLDRFKRVNDTLGHGAGDELLAAVAKRLLRCVRPGDSLARGTEEDLAGGTIARLGGDEFLVSLTELRHPEDAARVARRVVEALEEPFAIGDHEIAVTASVGISLYPEDGTDPESLLKNADAAMYAAKGAGIGEFRFYDPVMSEQALRRLSMESELRRGLERGELELHYQPQWDVSTGRIVGVEALMRWRHPESGLVSPGEFIPVAEETGLIAAMGEWALREACRQSAAWTQDGIAPVPIAVNISSRHFEKRRLVAFVEEALRASGVSPRHLEIEITEGLLMQASPGTVADLSDLRSLGVTIAIDDFGTGYSALGYLKRLPIDRLKIDRSFVRDLAQDPADAAIVSAILTMAEGLGIGVVAEGVENEAQLESLRSRGCKVMQGFLFARPAPAEEIGTLLREAARLGLSA